MKKFIHIVLVLSCFIATLLFAVGSLKILTIFDGMGRFLEASNAAVTEPPPQTKSVSARVQKAPRTLFPGDNPSPTTRVFEFDVLACPKCDGRMRWVATIMDRETIRVLLRASGLSSDSPPPDPSLGLSDRKLVA